MNNHNIQFKQHKNK